jgi:hypothetical protein
MAVFVGFVAGCAFTLSGAILISAWLAQRRLRRIIALMLEFPSASIADEVEAWLRDRG